MHLLVTTGLLSVCRCGELCTEHKSFAPIAKLTSRKTKFESVERSSELQIIQKTLVVDEIEPLIKISNPNAELIGKEKNSEESKKYSADD